MLYQFLLFEVTTSSHAEVNSQIKSSTLHPSLQATRLLSLCWARQTENKHGVC